MNLRRVWITLVLGIVCVKCEVKVSDGGYVDVTVSFSQSVASSNESKTLLESLQAQLEESSKVLQTAVGLRISTVTVVIPKSWDIEDWNLTVHPRYLNNEDHKADILITNSNDSVFGNFPHTLQYGSCGTPGHQVFIPVDFLLRDNTFSKGLALGREFLKYRYGVFDENGYHGDELYPLYYSIPGGDKNEIITTDCANKHIEYGFYNGIGNNCTEEELQANKCFPKPFEDSLENITSSLMYFHEDIPNMQHVCGKDALHHPHSPLTRNKHNAFCQGRSVWDVMKNSIDFQNPQYLKEGIEYEENKSIQFTYVQEQLPNVVITWENNKKFANQGPTILDAIRKFVYDLPRGSKRALFSFNEDVDEDSIVALSELDKWPEDWEIKQSVFQNPKDGCIECALTKALEFLDSDKTDQESTQGTIILIASSSLNQNDDLVQKIISSKACLTLFDFSEETSEEYKKLVEASVCGTLVTFSKNSAKKDIFESMFKEMEKILPEIVDDRSTVTVLTESPKAESPLEIPVDKYVESIAFWIFGGIEMKSIEIRFNNLILSSNELMKEISTTHLMLLRFKPNGEGTLLFTFKYDNEIIVQIRSTSNPGQYVKGEVFIEDLSIANASTQEPLILYANINYGDYPVQNAEVWANVSRPNEEPVVLKLIDDGAGDPDITANDGVFSRYFTSFSTEGDYSVTVTVQTDDTTNAGKLDEQGNPASCCGRSVKEGNLLIPKITKTLQTITFSAKSGRPVDGYKPSRIVDLKIDDVTDDQVILTWTAPGAEGDSGTVLSYDIRYFESQEDVVGFDKGKSLSYDTPQERGSSEKFEINMTQFEDNSLYFIAMQSKNENKSSDISNIVQVLISGLVITTTAEENFDQAAAKRRTIYIVIGVILGVIVLVTILYLVVYFVFLKPQRKKAKEAKENKSNRNGRPPNDAHVMNPVSFVSADTIMKHHTEKTRAKMENKDPPILKEEDFAQNSAVPDSSRVKGISERNYPQDESNEIGENSTNQSQMPPKSPKRTTFV